MFVYFVLLIVSVHVFDILSSNFYMFKPAIKVDNRVVRKVVSSFVRLVNNTASRIVGACKSALSKGRGPEPAVGTELTALPAGARKSDQDIARYPEVGQPAPHFSGTAVVDREFKHIRLKQYKGKYLVLLFYPLDFTLLCPTELLAFSEALPQFRRLNCEVVAASTDSHYQHFAWVTTPRRDCGLGDVAIPLLGDKSAKVARAYGVYDPHQGVALRALFIIDDRQRLRQIVINDQQVGRSVDETLRLVQAYQHSDKYGEGCPANWRPGDPTVKPLPSTAPSTTSAQTAPSATSTNPK